MEAEMIALLEQILEALQVTNAHLETLSTVQEKRLAAIEDTVVNLDAQVEEAVEAAGKRFEEIAQGIAPYLPQLMAGMAGMAGGGV